MAHKNLGIDQKRYILNAAGKFMQAIVDPEYFYKFSPLT
jgi:hypothetical protein